MEIRKSAPGDAEEILRLFAAARAFMVAHGNATQWTDGYPGRDVLTQDMRRGASYVLLEGGAIVGTFSLILGEEPTYQVIEDGHWRLDRPYGTIHRLASNGRARGVARACFDFCSGQIDYLRIDTHRDNLPMQAAVEKYGFRRCGTIYVRDHSPRIAYDFVKAEE